jgi:hypothetical protein
MPLFLIPFIKGISTWEQLDRKERLKLFRRLRGSTDVIDRSRYCMHRYLIRYTQRRGRLELRATRGGNH